MFLEERQPLGRDGDNGSLAGNESAVDISIIHGVFPHREPRAGRALGLHNDFNVLGFFRNPFDQIQNKGFGGIHNAIPHTAAVNRSPS